jgi:hypothetical protein
MAATLLIPNPSARGSTATSTRRWRPNARASDRATIWVPAASASPARGGWSTRSHTRRPIPASSSRGASLRIFAAGHVFEDLAIRWLRQAGFDLRTQTQAGGQFGFETAGGRIRGHVDGVIVGGPEVGLAWPVLWEHKALKASSWSDTVKKGVRLSKPVYYGQMQIYMAYLGLGSALFTALNKDSCELYHEHVPFDPATAQELSDKAVTVLRAADAGELLPRIATSQDFYLCRFCPFSARCWVEAQP